MRDHNALFAGELSGHYYFRDNYFAESTAMAIVSVANILSRSDRTLSEHVAPLQRYHASGEINSRVDDPDSVLQRLKDKYADGTFTTLDGITIEYEDWWMNVRCSNTEPLLRLNIEAKEEAMMADRRDEVLAVIRQ
ncbi:MAG: hypothetical protein HQ559_00050 [Lentisphaerae bacterium]|nr:hypothetical protein [Lentisphaerota bacterium]